ncbi:phage holin family protein [Massilia sp. IC2-278]|uniref:phage holin family protein n=1 Tax=Massilia sp. IC2-278 TaxID=2887200 RepID=UPI001E5E229D|nr:phage holin family protein [Massilia sp. IC2-278]MCC2961692.1 phage holin family protein [Massilia sp. IC2-278]
MAVTETLGRIGATLLAMVRTRLALAAVEAQEEAQRVLGFAAWTLFAAFLGAGAFMLVALFVIVLFWDTHRLLAIGGMAGLFALAAVLILARVRAAFAARPPMMAATLAELNKDIAFIKGTGAAHEQ